MSNNEFIKVDDLFKGKPDREERIPPGAWGNMQHLLETAGTAGGGVAGGSLNRYVALALLTLGIGTTAVTWQYNQRQPLMLTESSSVEAQPGTVVPQAQQSPAGTDQHNQSANPSAASSVTAQTASAGNGVANSPSATVARQQGAGHHTTSQQSATAPKPGGYNSIAVTAPQATQSSNQTVAKVKSKTRRQQAQQQSSSENEQIAQNLAALPQSTVNGTTTLNQTAAEQALTAIDKNMYAPKLAADSAYAAVVPGTNQKFVLTQQNEWFKEKSKTVNEIKAIYHIVKDEKGQNVTGVVMDTVKNVRVTRKYLAPLNEQDKMELLAITTKNTGIFVKARTASVLAPSLARNHAAAAAESEVSVAPLSEYKVASTNAQKGSFAKHFYDVLSNYFSMEKPYYFSAAIGMNSTLSNYMPTGYHFSIGGYYELKERLTLGAEVKYAHAGLLPQNILESYKLYQDQSSTVVNGQTMYSATEYNKQNSYQLESINSFEIPVTLRYQLSKFSVIGGLQATFYNPVKYTSIMNQDKEAAKTVLSETALVSTSGKINEADFRSRMALGYTAGIVYDLSKNISLDMRVSHNLWSNVRQTSQLSTQLYHYPNIQFSLFYFLGKKDKVIYMMSDRK